LISFTDKGAAAMKEKSIPIRVSIAVALVVLTIGAANSAEDKYTLKVPNGLAFAEFKGYEGWQVISLSHGGLLAVILGNPAMIEALKAGAPGNGRPFPDGARMAKIHWNPVKNETAPGQPLIAGTLHDVDFMVKDSRRFADSGGWGYAEFEYDSTSDQFRPGTLTDQPPQANDAQCGFACHTVVKKQDYVFTVYPKR
jgi:Cytochrome P460